MHFCQSTLEPSCAAKAPSSSSFFGENFANLEGVINLRRVAISGLFSPGVLRFLIVQQKSFHFVTLRLKRSFQSCQKCLTFKGDFPSILLPLLSPNIWTKLTARSEKNVVGSRKLLNSFAATFAERGKKLPFLA